MGNSWFCMRPDHHHHSAPPSPRGGVAALGDDAVSEGVETTRFTPTWELQGAILGGRPQTPKAPPPKNAELWELSAEADLDMSSSSNDHADDALVDVTGAVDIQLTSREEESHRVTVQKDEPVGGALRKTLKVSHLLDLVVRMGDHELDAEATFDDNGVQDGARLCVDYRPSEAAMIRCVWLDDIGAMADLLRDGGVVNSKVMRHSRKALPHGWTTQAAKCNREEQPVWNRRPILNGRLYYVNNNERTTQWTPPAGITERDGTPMQGLLRAWVWIDVWIDGADVSGLQAAAQRAQDQKDRLRAGPTPGADGPARIGERGWRGLPDSRL